MLAPNIVSEIERRALEIADEFDRKDGLRRAQIVPGTKPSWHMLKAAPGKENKVARYLSARAVGVFLPKFDPESTLNVIRLMPDGKTRAEKVHVGGKLIFPGRIFIFVWGILDHWRLVKSCPGVQSIVVDGAERPIIVPDSEIDKIQVLQFCLTPKAKNKRKRYQCSPESHTATMSTRSFWTVDDEKRTHVLDQSLGLAL